MRELSRLYYYQSVTLNRTIIKLLYVLLLKSQQNIRFTFYTLLVCTLYFNRDRWCACLQLYHVTKNAVEFIIYKTRKLPKHYCKCHFLLLMPKHYPRSSTKILRQDTTREKLILQMFQKNF